MVSDSGYNVSKHIYDQGTKVDDLNDIRGSLPLSSFSVVIVLDIYSDPSQIVDIDSIKQRVSNPELVDRMPRNSILGKSIDRNQEDEKIFFPISSFDIEPIKPGEHVLVVNVDANIAGKIGYWWVRLTQPIDVDDLNYTHADRKYQYSESIGVLDRMYGPPPTQPDFINGGYLQEQQTITGGLNAYDNINNSATANNQIVKELVARFTKRPADKVIMGSNASRIVLGNDRAGPAPIPASIAPLPNSATIDLVVGYGRTGTPTAPVGVINSRQEEEVDKKPTTPANALEGDPDMLNDPSRVYISESTDVDTNFVPNTIIPGVSPSPGLAPSVAVKSDRIRLLANGDIKIIGNNASIVLDEQGNITLVSNSQVKIGSAITSTQPVIKGQDFLSAFTGFLTTIRVAANSATSSASPPGNTAAISAIGTAANVLQQQLTNLLSSKVFIE